MLKFELPMQWHNGARTLLQTLLQVADAQGSHSAWPVVVGVKALLQQAVGPLRRGW
jgi:hypothetical protein